MTLIINFHYTILGLLSLTVSTASFPLIFSILVSRPSCFPYISLKNLKNSFTAQATEKHDVGAGVTVENMLVQKHLNTDGAPIQRSSHIVN